MMLEANLELQLRDMSKRLLLLVDQVNQGELVDLTLLEKLHEISEFVYQKYQIGQKITDEELVVMTELLSLIEMRTTFIYGNL